ncbi:flavin-containing monooxygenase [Thalassolituus oleivorans]|uniref:flavin-containing monooxygenase n=1 Tax=Thalassolituus oleivorans TaxID=187493 RepID=UPI0023F30AE8|nr:NAD(P)/FAD-dependent oxidoreductase [Thalassolituus oleivorans]
MSIEHFDVLIIGAGLSGIGTACHLSQKCPNKTYAILEGRDAIGGTWDLFRYPGIRSDSDMFTLGYNFKPWTSSKGIAAGGDICNYIREAAEENNVTSHVRYSHSVKKVNWDSNTARWVVDVEISNTGECRQYSAGFVVSCTGYYDYEKGFTPEFAGRDDFKGQVIHPQHWPENLDYAGKKVVVIGSGATAVTLIPSMARAVEKITMLQRSPSYILPVPAEDNFAVSLRKYLPETWVYSIIRSRNVLLSMAFFNYCKRFPERARKFIYGFNKKMLPEDFDMSHFTPQYAPWDQRLCAVPGGDLYKSISKGKADVVTDNIDRFTENGILLKSGKELAADIIITATGLNVKMFGGIKLTLDNKDFNFTDKMSYRGVLFEGIPNMAMVFGYTNSSWTLKSDLIGDWVCRLLKHMDKTGKKQVVPVNTDSTIGRLSFIDMSSGYIARVKDQLPQQGTKGPWKLNQNFFKDFASLKFSRLNAKELQYSNPQENKVGSKTEAQTA